MTEPVYPPTSAQIAERRKHLAPGIHDAFQEFSPYCIRAHTNAALRKGATEPELMEAIWVAAEMRAGGAYAHSTLALETASHAHGARAAWPARARRH